MKKFFLLIHFFMISLLCSSDDNNRYRKYKYKSITKEEAEQFISESIMLKRSIISDLKCSHVGSQEIASLQNKIYYFISCCNSLQITEKQQTFLDSLRLLHKENMSIFLEGINFLDDSEDYVFSENKENDKKKYRGSYHKNFSCDKKELKNLTDIMKDACLDKVTYRKFYHRMSYLEDRRNKLHDNFLSNDLYTMLIDEHRKKVEDFIKSKK